ncbi:hypothetical protein D9757_004335 [Collybiopsis confluens]|uniref:Uncharacterized protein n=1 Tax=Collybiopsis confluens TaxID=2823264 RepID=A0A8H5HTV8_9AGAR|nr:hypothetical protein D9757_004335 [Collybiopsis confluens]
MSIVVLSGLPASGKSSRAAQLKLFFDSKQRQAGGSKDVVLLSEDSLHITRSAYDNSAAEKTARAALLSAITRLLSQNTILIVDAPNYIKGFRYQIYCAAREVKVRVATYPTLRDYQSIICADFFYPPSLNVLIVDLVYILTSQEQCRQWNNLRTGDDRYSYETLENLFLRYEEPSSMVRWDSPLFTLVWTDESISQSTLDSLWDAVDKGQVKNPNSGTVAVSFQVFFQSSLSTASSEYKQTTKAPTDALATLEKTTLIIMQQMISSQDGLGGTVTLNMSSPSFSLKLALPPRSLTLPELSRLKRQFVTAQKKAITLGTIERGNVDWSQEGVGQRFVSFLEEQLQR